MWQTSIFTYSLTYNVSQCPGSQGRLASTHVAPNGSLSTMASPRLLSPATQQGGDAGQNVTLDGLTNPWERQYLAQGP